MAGISSKSSKEGTLDLALRGDWNAANTRGHPRGMARDRPGRRAQGAHRRRVRRSAGPGRRLGSWTSSRANWPGAHKSQWSPAAPSRMQSKLVRVALEAEVSSRPAALREDTLATPGGTDRAHDAGATGGIALRPVTFIGKVTHALGGALTHWHRLRPISIARHVYDTGITAIPIVALIAFLISVIIAYLSRAAAAQLRRRHLRSGSDHRRRAARAGRAADGDHRGGPLGQRIRGRDRLDAAQRGGRRAAMPPALIRWKCWCCRASWAW